MAKRDYEVKTVYKYRCPQCKWMGDISDMKEEYIGGFGVFIVCPQCSEIDVDEIPIKRYAIRRKSLCLKQQS